MEPENHGFQKDLPTFQGLLFRWTTLNFGGVSLPETPNPPRWCCVLCQSHTGHTTQDLALLLHTQGISLATNSRPMCRCEGYIYIAVDGGSQVIQPRPKPPQENVVYLPPKIKNDLMTWWPFSDLEGGSKTKAVRWLDFLEGDWLHPQKKKQGLFWAARWSTQKQTWDPSRRCGLTIHCQFPGSYHHPVTSDLFCSETDGCWRCACVFWGKRLATFYRCEVALELLSPRIHSCMWSCQNEVWGHAKIWDMALLLDVYFRSTLRFTYVIITNNIKKSHQNLNSNLCLKKLQYSSQSPFKKISKSQSPFSPYNLELWQISTSDTGKPAMSVCNQANIAEVVIPKAKVCANIAGQPTPPQTSPPQK